jgi:hypothetical protein
MINTELIHLLHLQSYVINTIIKYIILLYSFDLTLYNELITPLLLLIYPNIMQFHTSIFKIRLTLKFITLLPLYRLYMNPEFQITNFYHQHQIYSTMIN